MTKKQYKQQQHSVRLAGYYGVTLDELPSFEAEVKAAPGKMQSLYDTIAAEVEPVKEERRKPWRNLGNGVTPYLENSPELYGAELRETVRKYNPTGGHRIHSASSPVDCELSETERALVYCASRNDSPECPLSSH